MTRDDINKLFEKANGWSPAAYLNTMDDLARFAALVAAAEREACAKVCDVLGSHLGMGREPDPNDCAASIRARGD